MDRETIRLMELESIQPGCWPTAKQELLLKACLLSGDEALEAWRSWKNQIDLNWIDEGSNRLLPLLYHNLVDQKIDDPIMIKAKGLYRYVLAKNHLMLNFASEVIGKLQAVNIETMLLKGGALTLAFYKNYGLRPSLDVDLMVKPEHAIEAMQCLQSLGGIPEYEFPPEAVLLFRHSTGFDAGGVKRIDLHWNSLIDCRGDKIDDVFWSKSIQVEFKEVKTRVLNPTHQLFHNCAHGVRWNTHAPCRWVGDLMIILNNHASSIDWDGIATLSKERKTVIPIQKGFHYLRETFHAPIPDAALEKLDSLEPTKLEKVAYFIQTKNKNKFFGNFFKFSLDYLRLPKPAGFFGKLIAFPRYLQLSWKIKNIWLMPFSLIVQSIQANLKKPK